MNYTEFRKLVESAAKARGLDKYDLYYSAFESVQAEAFRHEIKQVESSTEGGVCFRCIANGRMGYASTESLCASEAGRIVEKAYENALSLESDEKEFIAPSGGEYANAIPGEDSLESTEDIVAKALEGQKALYAADEAVVDGSETAVMTGRKVIALANSNGLDLYREYTASGLYTAAVVSNGNEMKDCYEIRTGRLDTIDVADAANKAAAAAKAKIGSGPAPTGVYPVVFDPKAFASLLAAFSPVFSSDNVRKGLSLLAGKEGEVIASEAVTVTDDPFFKEAAMPMNFDAEGTPAYKKNVVENGVLKTLLYNLKTAEALGKKTTGNASRASFSAPVGVSPFTLYVAPGKASEEELIAKAGNGVYIDGLGGLHAGVDTVSGDFSLQSEGFMIENGKKTKAVSSFTVAGNFFTLLKSVTDVSDTVK
ncbi:MAG: TldD/PmbA family protein, partial [Clostridia bacterium]|nr:TldD/PmbA family protein [Clostridia bacterium]